VSRQLRGDEPAAINPVSENVEGPSVRGPVRIVTAPDLPWRVSKPANDPEAFDVVDARGCLVAAVPWSRDAKERADRIVSAVNGASAMPARPLSPTIGGDRALMEFRDSILNLLGEICDIGFDDLPELLLKLDGMRAECNQVQARAEQVADEQAERMAEPNDAGWVPGFNKGGR
jgi:hypothetical protein